MRHAPRVFDGCDTILRERAAEASRIFAEIEASRLAETAFAAQPEWIERNVVAHFEGGHAGAEFDDFTGRLMADDGRHPGKGAVGAEFP